MWEWHQRAEESPPRRRSERELAQGIADAVNEWAKDEARRRLRERYHLPRPEPRGQTLEDLLASLEPAVAR